MRECKKKKRAIVIALRKKEIAAESRGQICEGVRPLGREYPERRVPKGDAAPK